MTNDKGRTLVEANRKRLIERYRKRYGTDLSKYSQGKERVNLVKVVKEVKVFREGDIS